jgi:hypothetical protein
MMGVAQEVDAVRIQISTTVLLFDHVICDDAVC